MKTILNVVAALFLASGLGTVGWVVTDLWSTHPQLRTMTWTEGPELPFEDILDDASLFPLSSAEDLAKKQVDPSYQIPPGKRVPPRGVSRQVLFIMGAGLLATGLCCLVASGSARYRRSSSLAHELPA
jgi:hypothetical protein